MDNSAENVFNTLFLSTGWFLTAILFIYSVIFILNIKRKKKIFIFNKTKDVEALVSHINFGILINFVLWIIMYNSSYLMIVIVLLLCFSLTFLGVSSRFSKPLQLYKKSLSKLTRVLYAPFDEISLIFGKPRPKSK